MVFVCTWPLFYVGKLIIPSDGDDHSVLVVNVYRKHTVRKNKLIATFNGTIGEALQKFKDGGKRST